MKTKRIINAVIWAAITLTICAMVVVEWYAQGCGVSSLIAGIAMYTSVNAAIAFGIDQTIQGK